MARGRPSKKQHIIEAAGLLFADLGYQATSIDLVVQSAGVSKPTIYNNFPSKLHLFREWLSVHVSYIESLSIFSVSEDFNNQSALVEDIVEQIIAGYRFLLNSSMYLPVYRICVGEQQKLDEQILTIFRSLNTLIDRQAVEFLCDAYPNIGNDNAKAAIMLCRQSALDGELKLDKLLTDDELKSSISRLVGIA